MLYPKTAAASTIAAMSHGIKYFFNFLKKSFADKTEQTSVLSEDCLLFISRILTSIQIYYQNFCFYLELTVFIISHIIFSCQEIMNMLFLENKKDGFTRL